MVEIDVSEQAWDDINSSALYWSKFSGKTARLYIQTIYATIERLKTFPNLGHVCPFLEYPRVREVKAGPYRVIYHVVSERRIQIISVEHTSLPYDFDKIRPL